MHKLDFYILKKFLTTFVFTLLLFTLISVVVDTSEKADDFVRSKLSSSQIFWQYYRGFIPYIMAFLFPLFAFISVIFFTSKMAGRSEIVAILASGVSFRRLLRPYVVGSALLAGILWLAGRNIIPKANELRVTFQANYVDRNSSYTSLNHTSENMYFRIDPFTYAGIRYYDTLTKSGTNFFMHTIKNNEVVYNLRSENMRWDETIKQWRLTNVVERRLNGLQEKLVRSDSVKMKLNIKPEDLRNDDYLKDKLSTVQLDKYIDQQTIRGTEGLNTLKVERYRRDSTPVSVIILTIMGMAVAARKRRGGSGMHLAVGFISAAAFILTDRFSTIFATKGNLPPVLAAWIPNILFCLVALYMYRKAPK